MPHVYRVKLSDPYQMTTISLNDGTEAFKCYVSQQAAYLYEDTILTCTAQTDLSSYNSIDGSITFSLNFSNGDSNYEYELENAKYFKSGPMLIQLGDQMSGVVNFDSATFTENVLHSGRTTGYDSFESYHLGMRCPNGHFLGGTEKINYDNSNHNVNLDCSSVQVHSSNDFNDWWFPQSYNDINADVTCFGNSLWITLDEELDNGEMVWVNALQSLPVGTNTIDHVLQFQYSCLDTIANTTHVTEFSTTREFIVYQGENLATASAENAFIPSTKLISTTTTGWTGTYTSTYSTDSTFTVGTDTQTTPEVIIHVETPSTRLTSTTTTGWTGTYTSTYSTDSTFTVGTDTQTTPEVIIHVETPSTRLTSTTTTGWTGTYTSTYSTDSTFTVGTDTQTTPEVIIHVETPSTRLTSTTTTGWTGTYTSTYSTDSTFTVGTDTQTTPEVIIHVETPSTRLTSTTTTGWTGTYTSTYSTDSTFTVGTDTQTTPEVIIHVETPSTRLTSTTTTGWTGTYTSTYSTDSTFTVGTDTQTTPEVIIHVETPSTRLTSTTTTGWTGTYTSTYSTDSTFTVGTDTQTTPEVIIHVETPSTRLTSTTTTGWTGTYTSTYSTDSTFTVGTDTQTTPEVIIHVETPSAEQTLATVVTSTSTTAWSKPVETDTQRYTSSFSVTINSTSSVFLSTELETSHTPVVSTKSGHTTITTSGTPVSSEKSTTTTDRNLSSSAINSFNNSASNSQTSSPFISSSAPYEPSVHLSKSSLRSSLVHTSEQVPSSSIKTKTKVTSGYTTLSTTSRACSSCLDETASLSQNTKIETPIISSMVHYSSAPSSRPSPFNLQVSSMSTSHSFSIYEGKASAFFSSEFSTIFFLVLSYFLY